MTMGPNESETPGMPTGDLTDKVSVSYLTLSRLDDLKRDQERLSQEISGLRQETGGLHQNMGGLHQHMGTLRQAVSQDISGLRQEVSQDISGLRQEMAQHVGSNLRGHPATVGDEYRPEFDSVEGTLGLGSA